MIFQKPELRIREYCEIEIYHEYDGRQNINNTLSRKDIDAANSLNAFINRYKPDESKRLLAKSKQIAKILAKIPNTPLHRFNDNKWGEIKFDIETLLAQCLIDDFGLAKVTKILHLKRPEVFPVLDSYVIAFLLADSLSGASKRRYLRAGLRGLELARRIITKNKKSFEELQRQVRDLPIPLSIVRLFDILCWTTAKWDLQGVITAPLGVKEAKYSLLNLI